MDIKTNILAYKKELDSFDSKLIAVSKTKPIRDILEAYDCGQRLFGENKVQELSNKYPELPKDIEWHMIGHLQTNKVKYIAPFVSLIHSVDSIKLLKEINKQGKKNARIIDCLLQIKASNEETKFGIDPRCLDDFLNDSAIDSFEHVRVIGLMGMASNTEDKAMIRSEFEFLHTLFDRLQEKVLPLGWQMKELSMGMSNDYEIAIECGSTMVRIGSSIFGKRNYI